MVKGSVRLFYYRHLPGEPELPFEHEVLYQDEHLLVADKPHFMPVTPRGYDTAVAVVQLKRQLGLPDRIALHRIDRDTAGAGAVFSAAAHFYRRVPSPCSGRRSMAKGLRCVAWNAGMSWVRGNTAAA